MIMVVSILGLLVWVALSGGLVLLVLLWNSGPNGRTAATILGLMAGVIVLAVGLLAFTAFDRSVPAVAYHESVQPLRHGTSSRSSTIRVRETASVQSGTTAEAVPVELTAEIAAVPTKPELLTQAEATETADVSNSASDRARALSAVDEAPTATEFHDHYSVPVTTVQYKRVPLLLILFVGAGVVLLVVSLFKSSRVGLAVALIAGCLLLFLFVATWTSQRSSVSRTATIAAYNSQDALPYPFGTRELPAIQSRLDTLGNSQDIWTTEANDTHVSGTFASLEKLGRGVASRVIDRLKQSNTLPDVITVQQRNSQNAGADLTQAVVGCTERLKTEFPEMKVNSIFGSNSYKTGAGIAAVSLTVRNRVRRNAPWDVSEMAVEYEIRAELEFDDSQYPFGVNYVEKPWVDNVSKYLVNRPQQMLLRARSSSLHQSESHARREAYQTAASHIAPQLATYLRLNHPDLRNISNLQCEQAVENAIANQNLFVIDRFPQSVEVRGHDLWRESVLLNVDPDGLAHIARMQAGAHRVTWRREVSNTVAMACLLVLVIGVCVGLNSMTKGYYKNPLVIFAGISVLGVFLLLLS